MADYWETGATNGGDAATTGGATQPANGDANMDEEILVSCLFAIELGTILIVI
jgi:hypothetical protein